MKTQIFCNNCNASLYEDTKFCPECGAKVEPQDNIEQETVFCPNCGTSTSMESEFCSECGKAIYQEAGKDTISIDETQKKKAVVPFKFKVKPLYIGIAAAIFLIAIFGFVAGKGGSNAQNGIIYAKDNELQFMYLSKLNTFEMTDKLNNDSYTLTADDYLELSDYILTSNDGRYIFYPDRIEDGLSYYWRDLKADNIKNDAAVKIDSNISDQLFLDGSGNKFFYIKDDNNRLYVFDRKSGEKNKLDEEVIDFYVNEEGNYIIYSKFIDNEYFIYEMTLSGITGEKNKIDSNAKIQRISTDEKRIYYIKDDALYHKESGKDKVKIASDVYQTDFSYNSYNGNLCINKDGKETKIADDVSYFSPIDEKNVAFLTDYSQNKGKGELKLYDGANKPKLIDSDITAVLWKPNMRWWFY